MFYVWKIAAFFYKEKKLKVYCDFQLKTPTNQTSSELTTDWILTGYQLDTEWTLLNTEWC